MNTYKIFSTISLVVALGCATAFGMDDVNRAIISGLAKELLIKVRCADCDDIIQSSIQSVVTEIKSSKNLAITFPNHIIIFQDEKDKQNCADRVHSKIMDDNGNTVLHYLCAEKSQNLDFLNVFKHIFQAMVDIKNNDGQTPLHLLAKVGNSSKVLSIIDCISLETGGKYPINGLLCSVDNMGKTPLDLFLEYHPASGTERSECAQALMTEQQLDEYKAAHPDADTNKTKDTPEPSSQNNDRDKKNDTINQPSTTGLSNFRYNAMVMILSISSITALVGGGIYLYRKHFAEKHLPGDSEQSTTHSTESV